MPSYFDLMKLLKADATLELPQGPIHVAEDGQGIEVPPNQRNGIEVQQDLLLSVFKKLKPATFVKMLRTCKDVLSAAEERRESIQVEGNRSSQPENSATPQAECPFLTFEILAKSSSEPDFMLRIATANKEYLFILTDFIEDSTLTMAADLSLFFFQTIYLKTDIPPHEQVNYLAAVDRLLQHLSVFIFTCEVFKPLSFGWYTWGLNSKALKVFNPRNVLFNLAEIGLPLSSLVQAEDLSMLSLLEVNIPCQGNEIPYFDYAMGILLPSCNKLYLKFENDAPQSFDFVKKINSALQRRIHTSSSTNQELHIRFEKPQWDSNPTAFFEGLSYKVFTFTFNVLTVVMVPITNSKAHLAVIIRKPERSNPLQPTDPMLRLFRFEGEGAAIANLSPFYSFHWKLVHELNDLVTFIFMCGTGHDFFLQKRLDEYGAVIQNFLLKDMFTLGSLKERYYPTRPQPVIEEEW